MDEADRICDVVAFMHHGEIVAMNSPAKLKNEISPHATLDEVFIKHTGTSIEGGDYDHAKQVRRTISNLD
jgi:ABC-2 type transport system ATP-binding protein